MKGENETTNLIVLSNFSTTVGAINTLRNEIRKRLGNQLFEFKTMDEFVFEVLKLIDPVQREMKSFKNNSKGMKIVLKHFKLEKSRQNLYGVSNLDNKTVLDDKDFNFKYFILGLNKLPYYEIKELKPQVEYDLKLVNDLILKYEEDPAIIHFRKDYQVYRRSNIPIVQFYWRCLDARQEILNYYFNGMYDWAINLCSHFGGLGTFAIAHLFSVATHRPYEFNRNEIGPNYDYWNIDRSSHRILHSDKFSVKELPFYHDLYESDKRSFYERFFGLYPKEEVIEEILVNIKYLSTDRQLIFNRMIHYFKNEEWLAFYSIALPQIEGLFSEIMESESLNEKPDSLSKKVRSLRENAYLNVRALDYYEYKLPEQRNNFAHGGILEDIELLAYDTITDLNCLLHQFSELENPYIQASRVLNLDSPPSFDGLFSLGEFFKLILNLKDFEEDRLKSRITQMNNEFILPNEDSFKEMFRFQGVRYDFGKADFNDELQKLGFKVLDEIDDLVRELKGNEAILEIKREFIGFLFETEELLDVLELTRRYASKYFHNDFLTEVLDEYGSTEKKAMFSLKNLNRYKD